MPLYDYQCLDCSIRDPRLSGLDDHTAICHGCGGLMLRITDPFSPLAALRLGDIPSQEDPPCDAP